MFPVAISTVKQVVLWGSLLSLLLLTYPSPVRR
jgi:hypothetical protein